MKSIKKIIKYILKKVFLALWKFVGRRIRVIERITLPKFANEPKNLKINFPRKIINSERMYIGDNVQLGPNCFLYAKTDFKEPYAPLKEQRERYQKFNPTISIGSRVRCGGGGLRITAMDNVTIEDDVGIGENVFICDGSHGYRTADEPYRYQPMENIKPIVIKRGSQIGRGVFIAPGVTIGENSMIGANSVVTKSIKAKSIAVGNPAKIVREWDDEKKTWIRVDNRS